MVKKINSTSELIVGKKYLLQTSSFSNPETKLITVKLFRVDITDDEKVLYYFQTPNLSSIRFDENEVISLIKQKDLKIAYNLKNFIQKNRR